jgi:3-phenylpropionate/trans-cinnamate dioxygenase ferredoxin reductase subunit
MEMGAIIVGAGQAGAHAALAMRNAGYPGAIRLIGAEADRPHERPPLSKQMLTAAEEPSLAYFHSEQRYADNGITLMCGVTVVAIDPAARTVQAARTLQAARTVQAARTGHLQDARALQYTHLLLTTGGRARRLDVPGAENVLTMRTVADARALRRRLVPGVRVVCVGGGVIGLEVASSARARGCVVTVIEAAPALMGRSLGPVLSKWLADLHRAAGVDLRLGTAVAAVTPEHVICADGSVIPAELVVAGIGMERETGIAERAGLAIDNGIVVDEFGRTSEPGIFAAGDVAAFWVPRLQQRMRLETWRHAQDHGAAVGRAIAGSGLPYDEIPWFWTDQHGVNLQIAGVCADAPVTVIRGEIGAPSFAVWCLDAACVPIGVAGVNAPREVRAGLGLIRAERPVDPARLADAGVPPQRLAATVMA